MTLFSLIRFVEQALPQVSVERSNRQMHSSWYGKVEKAHRYAAEPAERITFQGFAVEFRGDNDTYRVTLQDGTWHCTCHFFAGWGRCCHTMALEEVLRGMLRESDAVSGAAPREVLMP